MKRLVKWLRDGIEIRIEPPVWVGSGLRGPVPGEGLEPPTHRLQNGCSTTELTRPVPTGIV